MSFYIHFPRGMNKWYLVKSIFRLYMVWTHMLSQHFLRLFLRLGNATVAIKLLDEDKNQRKYYKILFTKVGGNLINVQLYENTISSGFLFGTYNRQGILLQHFRNILPAFEAYLWAFVLTFMCRVCIKFSILIGLVRTALVNIPLDLNYLQFNEDLGDSGDTIPVSSNADYHGFWIRYYCIYQIFSKIPKNSIGRFYFPNVIFEF